MRGAADHPPGPVGALGQETAVQSRMAPLMERKRVNQAAVTGSEAAANPARALAGPSGFALPTKPPPALALRLSGPTARRVGASPFTPSRPPTPDAEREAVAQKRALDAQRAALHAQREAEATAQREAEAKAQLEAAAQAQREAEAKAQRKAAAQAKREAAARAQHEAEAHAQREAAARAQREAEAHAQREAAARAQREAEAKAQREAAARAQRESEAKAQREAAAQAQRKAAAAAAATAPPKARTATGVGASPPAADAKPAASWPARIATGVAIGALLVGAALTFPRGSVAPSTSDAAVGELAVSADVPVALPPTRPPAEPIAAPAVEPLMVVDAAPTEVPSVPDTPPPAASASVAPRAADPPAPPPVQPDAAPADPSLPRAATTQARADASPRPSTAKGTVSVFGDIQSATLIGSDGAKRGPGLLPVGTYAVHVTFPTGVSITGSVVVSAGQTKAITCSSQMQRCGGWAGAL